MSTPPAVYYQFGQALAFAERTLTVILHEHLAQRGTPPETWYALRLVAARGPGLSRQDLVSDLEGSMNVPAGSVPGLLSRLQDEGLISGTDQVGLTPQGEELYRGLREYVVTPTARLLGQFDPSDIETTVRTLQSVTSRAAQEAAATAG